MTSSQKQLIDCLLKGMYLMQRVCHDGELCYKLYEGNMRPVRYYPEQTIRGIRKLCPYEIFKKDKRSRITLHLANIRRMHGRSWIKQRYKAFKIKKLS